MQKTNNIIKKHLISSDWLTINEAVKISRKKMGIKIRDVDIYRHALAHNILLSIYFQTPIFLRRVKFSNGKPKLFPANDFISKNNYIASTTGNFITPSHQIIDTDLLGYEYVLIQQYLAQSLHIHPPSRDIYDLNPGIFVNNDGDTFQVFKKKPLLRMEIPKVRMISTYLADELNGTVYSYYRDVNPLECLMPVYTLPNDACFVIKNNELHKLVKILTSQRNFTSISSRISTPLSRMFWLACKNNEAISPLMSKPYKLLSIFEQWASHEGITDRLSGDTLKNALNRGAPSSTSLHG